MPKCPSRTSPGKRRCASPGSTGTSQAEATARLRQLLTGPLPPGGPFRASNGRNISLTCRHSAVPGATVCRWLKRYDPEDLTSLEDRSSRPHRCRQRTWTADEVESVRELREQYPCWGKMKLVKLLKGPKLPLSPSRVGRIIAYLKRRGMLKEPPRIVGSRRRQWKRQYACRKPKGYDVKRPGDLVQIDTMDVRPEPGVVLKQFSTVDVISRWSVPTVVSNATANLACRALHALIDRTPFPVRAIQIDGGSEFEEESKKLAIKLFVLPPRSPKLNGCVERINRTYREEFYNCSTAAPTVAAFAKDLRRWEHVYNHIRPHQALGYLTPAQFLWNWAAAQQLAKEELSQAS